MTYATDPQAPQNNEALMDEAAILSFIGDLIQEKRDPNITEENLPQVKEMLLQEVNNAINTHLVNLLSEQDQIELDGLLDKDPSDEELNQFFLQKIPNLEIEIAAALLNFRAAYLYPVTQDTQGAASLQSPIDIQQQPEEEDLSAFAPLPAPLAPGE